MKEIPKKYFEIIKRNKHTIFMILGAVLLLIIYVRNLLNIYTVWEMPDEGGYLFNAALFSNHPWKEVFSNSTAYYGFGYSVLLVPIFFLCNSGIQLIQGAVLVNIFLIVSTYFIQIYLMQMLFEKVRKELWVVASFVICLYPYITCNIYKVIPEVFLNFQLWFIAALLYKAVKSNRLCFYVALSLATVYIYFIHTRSIVIVGVMILILAYLCITKKITLKRLSLIFGIMAIAFVGLYVVKGNIVDILGTGKIALQSNKELGNLLTGSYFSDRISWLFLNLTRYFLQAIGKAFYLIASTMGIFVWGIICLFKKIRSYMKNHKQLNSEKSVIVAFLGFSFIFTFLVCCVNGSGDTYAAMLYGRYYEYTVGAVILFGIGLFFEKGIKEKEILCTMLLSFVTGMCCLLLTNYAGDELINPDTCRLSGITYAINIGDNQYSKTIYILIVFVMCFMFICMLLLNKRWKDVIIILLLVINFYQIDKENISIINSSNDVGKSDVVLADYMVEHWGNQEAYFIYEPYRYDSYYQRLQIFVKDYPIHVIFPNEMDQINDGDYIITYSNSEKANEMKMYKEEKHIMQSKTYELFVK